MTTILVHCMNRFLENMSENPETVVVNAATRTLDILEVFSMDRPHMGLSDIARASQMPKATALRLLRTLQTRGYVVQLENSEWRLGPANASLGARYQRAFDIRSNVEPVLRKLSDATGRSASFFVLDGNRRIRLIKVLGPDGSRDESRVGDVMPLEQGAAGWVILAASGRNGKVYQEIRNRGYHITAGEARQSSASIAVPVFGSRWRVIGALCIGASNAPGVEEQLVGYAQKLTRAANMLSAALSHESDGAMKALMKAKSTWSA